MLAFRLFFLPSHSSFIKLILECYAAGFGQIFWMTAEMDSSKIVKSDVEIGDFWCVCPFFVIECCRFCCVLPFLHYSRFWDGDTGVRVQIT